MFRAFWRWHFYASALVIPVFALLSITGLIMLFKWQLDPLQEPGLTYRPPAHGPMKSLAAQQSAALQAVPGGTITAVQTPADDRSTFFTLTLAGDQTRNVYVNPYTAEVLGVRDPRTLLSNLAHEIHGMVIYGPASDCKLFDDPITGEPFTVGSIGDRIIETATCWAIVMTLTGYYLYWRGRPTRRVRSALRSRHGTVGALAGVAILAMVITALPWTGLFGHTFQRFANGTSWSMWGDDPGARSSLGETVRAAGSDSRPAPWDASNTPVPTSGPHAGHHMDGKGNMSHMGHGITVDQAVTVAATDGAQGPFYVTYPQGDDGVYSVLADPWHDRATPASTDVSKSRVVHVDQYSGAIAGRYDYRDYAPLAKVVTQGVALHEGQRLGTLNLVASAAFCLAILFLCVTGPVMWWRRRTTGLSAPRGSLPIRSTPWLMAALVVLGLLLPLFGVTLVLVLILDRFVIRRSERLSGALGAV